ncbi:MAG: CDP-alcohol phosphatidyltransferase family protein [Candidatus Tectomicrobia bacterium]|uniref:Bifunctional IPC transferase and DIPP synthase n=1 Tax=Tectimicrobiota bacterium TaxID=2528274 RepID=A0A938B173_UNCTE|nr:CDP-alcohol phosphatidyltransferase family protein [Candidatus Tectomicrobia bacterium]
MPPSTTGVVIIAQGPWFAEIAGVPLLHRIMLNGRRAGIGRWIILAQHEAQWVHSSLATAAKLREVTWQVYDLQTTSPEQLAAAMPLEDLVLVTAPIVFDHRLLQDLQQSAGPTLGVTTAAAVTPADLVVHDGMVAAGTAQAAPAYRSTGILRCPSAMFTQVLQQIHAELRQSPTGATLLCTRLLAQAPIRALDMSRRLWLLITEPLDHSVPLAETQLLRSLGREGDSILVRTIDRRLSQAITRRLMHTPVTPNQMTVLSATVGLLGAICLAQPTPMWQILGSLLFLLSTIMDGCDGELARLTFRESAFGAKLDLVMDNVVHLFLFPCIALGLYRRESETLYFVLGALTLGGILVSMAVYLPYLLRRQPMQSTLTRVHEHLASRDFAYVLPILAVFDKLQWFLWATTVGTYVFAVAWVVITARERRPAPSLRNTDAS